MSYKKMESDQLFPSFAAAAAISFFQAQQLLQSAVSKSEAATTV